MCICVFIFLFHLPGGRLFIDIKKSERFLLHFSLKYESLSGCEAHSSVVFRYYFLRVFFFHIEFAFSIFLPLKTYISVHNAIEFSLIRPTKLIAHSRFRYLSFSFDISLLSRSRSFVVDSLRVFGVYFTFALKYQHMIVWHYKWIFFSALYSLILINCSIWKEFIKNIQVIYHEANRREDEYQMTPSSLSPLSLCVFQCITISFPLNANVCVRMCVCVSCCSHYFSIPIGSILIISMGQNSRTIKKNARK